MAGPYRAQTPSPAPEPRRPQLSPYARAAVLVLMLCPLSGASCGAAEMMHGRSAPAEGAFVGLAVALIAVLIAWILRILLGGEG